jgi:predicted MFS family arabinose efflux permease
MVFVAGCLVIVIWPTFWALGLSLTVIAVAKVIYDPAMQAYIGDVVEYGQRGRILSITELSWAGAFFLGVPAIGFVIARRGWTAPFFWLALLGIGGAILLWQVLPRPAADNRTSQATSLRKTINIIKKEKVIWAAASYLLLVMAANELLLVIYGLWMEDNFSLSLTSLGLATAVIGGAELSGEVLTAISVDRIGKRRFVLITGLATGFMYVAVPFANLSLLAALVTLFILFLFFEMTVVGGVPLLTELVPTARGIVMSVALAAGGLGRALGALIGPQIWLQGGMAALGLTSAVLMMFSMVILALWVREGVESQNQDDGYGPIHG